MNQHVERLIVRRSDVRAGMRFGRLRVLGATFRAKVGGGWEQSYVVCRCTCAAVLAVDCTDLTKGRMNSCGCGRATPLQTPASV